MNQRILDRILPILDVPPDDEEAVRRVAEVLDERAFAVVRHEVAGNVVRFVFSDGEQALQLSVPELREHAAALQAGHPFPWAEELRRQGNPP